MFKAFLRTDGTVTVMGGDIAWKFQKRQYQRLITAKFAYAYKRMGQGAVISDLTSIERTISVNVCEFVGSNAAKISDTEYQYCRAILKELVVRKDGLKPVYAVAV